MVWFLAFVLLAQSGCGTDSQPAAKSSDGDNRVAEVTLPAIQPSEYLRSVISRYQNEKHYRDQGFVRMVVERDGQSTTEEAPMSVHLEGGKIQLAAYDARLWSDGKQTLGWIADPSTNMHDGQVVVGGSLRGSDAVVKRPTLELMLRDPILTSKMKAGLGGPPPQLEWLLADDPMANLFRGKQVSRIEYVGIMQLQNVNCVVVLAEVEGEYYRFWVDRQRSIVKLIELPTSVAEVEVTVEGFRIASLELVLADATFNTSSAPFPSAPKNDFPSRPVYLRSLLPLPPHAPHPQLGRELSKFRVRDASDRYDVTQRGVDRLLTLFIATNDAAESNVAADMQLISFASLQLANLTPEQRAQVRPVVVTSPDRAAQLRQIGVEQSEWILVSAPAALREFDSRPTAVLINARGKCLFAAHQFMANQLTTLPAIISDTLAGVDVTDTLLKQWQADQKAYREKLYEMKIDR
ncbi:hypothetical protein [Stieleria sp. JC731]|uniref:hypothetical protein n=1 Tax=Pirellulaceae TaxID=2691357 RepID=UPI001E368EE0|nr:hypothetical protein [Stieleria sp. JC731]